MEDLEGLLIPYYIGDKELSAEGVIQITITSIKYSLEE